MYIDALHKTAHITERLKTMLKPQVDPRKLADLMACKENGCALLTHEQYEFWCEQVKDQVMFKISDAGDDGYVVRHVGMYIAFWFTGVRHSEGLIDMHTMHSFAVPFEALGCITDIIKTDHEEEQEEAQSRLFAAADEVA